MDDLVRWYGEQLDEDERLLTEVNASPEMVTGIPRSYAAAPVALPGPLRRGAVVSAGQRVDST